MESFLFEVNAAMEDIKYTLNRIDKWVQPDKAPSQIPMDKSFVLKEPYGVVLVMSAWNFPLNLLMVPVHGTALPQMLPRPLPELSLRLTILMPLLYSF